MALQILVLFVLCTIDVYAKNINNVCNSVEDYVQNITTNPNCWYDPDLSATPKERAQNNGFLLDEHKVRTEDGYILTTFRLKSLSGLHGKDVVFIQHGMTADSSSYMVNKENSIPFFLARQGFDVWLGNFRGMEYCTHERLTPNDPKYWDFSYDEHGLYDLPANFKYISEKTKRKIVYIGHSMGSTSMGIYASMRPNEAKQYISYAILIAPAWYMRHTRGLVSAEMINRILPLLEYLPMINLNVMMDTNSFERIAFRRFCLESLSNVRFCLRILSELAGPSIYPIDPERFPMILSAMKGTSMKNLFHYIQAIQTGRYRMYDYGSEENMIRYNRETPPDFNLTEITIPLSLIYGINDNMVTKEDVLYAFNTYRKPNWRIYEIPHTHFDFLFSKAVKRTFLPLLLKLVNKGIKKYICS